MNVRGTSAVFLVVADPVAQVLAPRLYNHLFEQAGIDAVVVPAQVGAGRLAAFVHEAMAVGNFKGLFVSIPHKTPLMDVLDRFDDAARAAGAVNAVRRGADGALEGALFDGVGFVGALGHCRVPLHGRRALIVGAGGAGLAIASALAACPLASLTVVDAVPERALLLAERVRARAGYTVTAPHRADVADFDLLIQATPLGLKPGDPLPLDAARIDPGATVFDILMTPEPTPLLRACRTRGIAAHSGHEMLIQQVPAYLHYFGFTELAERMRARDDALLNDARSMLLAGDPEN